jgi:quercetin dioxygenase-like cupin family protein
VAEDSKTADPVLPAFRHLRWDEVPHEQVSEMYARRLVWGERQMVAQITMKKGCDVPEHVHESEQVTWVLKGALRFRIQGREIVVGENELVHIPSNVPHAAFALEETFELDVFSPIRQDWLDKTDAYLRR